MTPSVFLPSLVFSLTLFFFDAFFRLANMKEYIFKFSGLTCCTSALVSEIILADSQCWRLWEFNNKDVQFVSTGLWEAYYTQDFNISGSMTRMLVHTPINSTWNKSSEFQYLQVLIAWAILMKILVLVFTSVAIKLSCMEDQFIEIQLFCYKMSAIILAVSSLFTLVTVTLNHLIDMYGQTTLDFSPDFPVKKEDIIKKHCTNVFPYTVGVLTTTMSLFGVILFFYEMISLTVQSQVKAQCASNLAEQKVRSEGSGILTSARRIFEEIAHLYTVLCNHQFILYKIST
ncbi:LOW QUALITY PROTEIN: uncharacterized protein LOC114688997 [Peromyscus leucopus]|uniref:LOW QUALITY PROTEIN: uncharacterized protein LOC114688997 n=1 Tax=Peromyscus leucopus TaxID=10041 RepID=UPI001884BD92|nr:LOW QUALITY PROTEIN: uncharacterized protein LOC114688997 [Peromyscus leucopus]